VNDIISQIVEYRKNDALTEISSIFPISLVIIKSKKDEKQKRRRRVAAKPEDSLT